MDFVLFNRDPKPGLRVLLRILLFLWKLGFREIVPGMPTDFFLCNSFFIIELTLKIVIKDSCSPSYQKNFEIIVRLMRILNAISNALVYCIADRTFRRHLRFYLKRIFYPLFCKMIPILEPKTVEEESSTHHKSQQFGDNTPLTRTPLHTPLTARRFQSSIQDLRRGSNLSVEFKRPQTNTLSP